MKYLFFLITFMTAGAVSAQMKMEAKQFILKRSDATQILAELEDPKRKPSNVLCAKLLTLELYTEDSKSYTEAVTLNIESDLYEKLGKRPPKGKRPDIRACIAMKKLTRYDLCGVFRHALGAETSVPCLGPGYVVLHR